MTLKTNLHPRNPHRFRYDFPALILSCPQLATFVEVNQYGNESINFASPEAVKMLNKALLVHFYGISFWDIPDGYLCAPIPGRADYIHYCADLLGSSNEGVIPTGKNVSVLDIGIGANCVYPLIGSRSYGWHFVGTDIDSVSIASVKKIVAGNSVLEGLIETRLQDSPPHVFNGIIRSDDFFDISICNPPFHASKAEADEKTLRKVTNLKLPQGALNFGGQNNELWCPGGEVSFIQTMSKESLLIRNQCFWFTTLVSKKENLDVVYKALKKVQPTEVRTIDMAQGQKMSRIVCWTFLDSESQKKWRQDRWL